jgi:hypothetical protein
LTSNTALTDAPSDGADEVGVIEQVDRAGPTAAGGPVAQVRAAERLDRLDEAIEVGA